MRLMCFSFTLLLSFSLFGQTPPSYETTTLLHPYGQINPEAPEALNEFDFMIGTCSCKSLQRDPSGAWKDTVSMYWSAEYIMDGHAILDHTWKANGKHTINLRQWDTKNEEWVVSYFSTTAGTNFEPWRGKKVDSKIILRRPHTTPTGMEGQSTLQFYNISDRSYDWKGEWVSNDGSAVYPFWYIWCKKI